MEFQILYSQFHDWRENPEENNRADLRHASSASLPPVWHPAPPVPQMHLLSPDLCQHDWSLSGKHHSPHTWSRKCLEVEIQGYWFTLLISVTCSLFSSVCKKLFHAFDPIYYLFMVPVTLSWLPGLFVCLFNFLKKYFTGHWCFELTELLWWKCFLHPLGTGHLSHHLWDVLYGAVHVEGRRP